ncbi:hypothetical protein [Deinococcus sp.]|uniref:hypothetical protein n=1 Tax=Deinococcus sp. TaxID=47478 RepID=UPI002869C577|nr:hypothetical protein [Deinococcus sp.]
MTPRPPPTPEARRREGLLIGRLLGTLTTATFAGMALWFLHLGVYVGHARSGREIVLSGPAATALNVFLLGIAGLPLALWARNGRQAAWWATGCVTVAAVALISSLRLG